MPTDWKLTAQSRALEATPPQIETYSQVLTALEAQLAALKQSLPYDAEPATFPQPVIED